MDKVKKFLRKLSDAQQDKIDNILFKIESNKTEGLNVRKLKGHQNLFRVRAGDIRIVFTKNKKKSHILFIGHRGGSKYKKF